MIIQHTPVFQSGLPVLVDLPSVTRESGERFYTLPNGTSAPSITTVLKQYGQDKLVAWKQRVGEVEAERVRHMTAHRGTALHAVCESYLRGLPIDSEAILPTTWQSFRPLAKYLQPVIRSLHYLETTLYSYKLQVAGRVDCIAEFDGTLSVIDFKTSTKAKQESWITHYFEQATGYALMYEELIGTPITQLVILIALDNPPGKFQIFQKSTSQYADSLRSKISRYHEEHPCYA